MDTNLLRELFVLRFLILLGAFALTLGVAALIEAWRTRTTRHSRRRQSENYTHQKVRASHSSFTRRTL